MSRKKKPVANKAAEGGALPETAEVPPAIDQVAELAEGEGERRSPGRIAVRFVRDCDQGRRGRVRVLAAGDAHAAIDAEVAVPATAQDCAIAGVVMPASE